MTHPPEIQSEVIHQSEVTNPKSEIQMTRLRARLRAVTPHFGVQARAGSL